MILSSTGLPSRLARWAAVAFLASVTWYAAAQTNGVSSSTNIPAADPQRPFIAFGRVTDPSGAPLAGVTITAHCGMGTLLPTGTATTGENGDYRLAFGPGLRTRMNGDAPSGVGLQVATISARKPGYFARDLGRAGNLAMTDSTRPHPAWVTNLSGVVRLNEPYRLDFTLSTAGSVTVSVSDPGRRLPAKVSLCLTGEKLPPSSSVLGCAEIGPDARHDFADVPVGYSWRFEITWRKGDAWKTIRSPDFAKTNAAPEVIQLRVTDSSLEFVK